jgi:TonB family protein
VGPINQWRGKKHASRFATIASLLTSAFVYRPTQAIAIQGLADNQTQTPQPASDADLHVPVQTYVPPVSVELKKPRYPRDAQEQGIEGWGVVNFMVDRQGGPYEVEATADGGHKSFGKAAVRAIQKSTFKPARANGETINASAAVMTRFGLSGGRRGASRAFVRLYREFSRALKSEDLEAIEKYLGHLTDFKATRIYEMAYLNLAKAAHAQKKDDHSSAMTHLTSALRWEEGFSIFGKKEHRRLLHELFWLQVQSSNLGEALDTWQALEPLLDDPDQRDRVATTVAQILDLKTSESAVSAQGTIDGNHQYGRKLLKRAFSLSDVIGTVRQAKLYCDKGFVGILIEPHVRYDIHPNYKDCRLFLVGIPGTTFKLIERP